MRVKDRMLGYALSRRSRIVLNAPPGLNRSRKRNLDVRDIVCRERAPGAGAADVDSSPKLYALWRQRAAQSRRHAGPDRFRRIDRVARASSKQRKLAVLGYGRNESRAVEFGEA